VQELVDVENGIDVRVDPVTRTISTFAPTAFADRTNTAFGYGVEPFNLANAPQNDDGSNTANRITAVGSNGIAVPADDAAAIAAEGIMREDWLSLSDVADPAIIGAYANAELIYRRYGQVTYDLAPLPYGDVPRLYDDFELGDKVYLSVDAGALRVDSQAIRVFSVTIDVDAQGLDHDDGRRLLERALVLEQLADQPVGALVALARDVPKQPAVKAHQRAGAARVRQRQRRARVTAHGPEAVDLLDHEHRVREEQRPARADEVGHADGEREGAVLGHVVDVPSPARTACSTITSPAGVHTTAPTASW
jgi:hypothetical protein